MTNTSFKDFVLDQLGGLGPVRARAMFGGFGLYAGRVFFGIVHEDRLYFKVSEATRASYEGRGQAPFRPNARQTLKSFYEVPLAILESPAALVEWARDAAAAGGKTRRQ